MRTTTRQTCFRTGIGLAVVLLFVASACGGTTGPEEAEDPSISLTFGDYATGGDAVLAAESTIEVGAFVDGRGDISSSSAASGAPQPKPVELTIVSSQSPETISVDNVQKKAKNTFELRAHQPGTATIEIEGTTPRGAEVSDQLTIPAEATQSVELSHDCSESNNDPVYLTGQPVDVRQILRADDGRRLVGWGRHPVELSPETGGVSVEERRFEDRVAMQTGTETGPLEVVSSIDDSSLTLTRTTEEALTEFEWLGGRALWGDPTTPDRQYIVPHFEAEVDNRKRSVCQAQVELSIANDTPDICQVEVEQLDTGAALGDSRIPVTTAVRVEKATQNPDETCRFSVDVPEASADLEQQVEIDLSETDGD